MVDDDVDSYEYDLKRSQKAIYKLPVNRKRGYTKDTQEYCIEKYNSMTYRDLTKKYYIRKILDSDNSVNKKVEILSKTREEIYNSRDGNLLNYVEDAVHKYCSFYSKFEFLFPAIEYKDANYIICSNCDLHLRENVQDMKFDFSNRFLFYKSRYSSYIDNKEEYDFIDNIAKKVNINLGNCYCLKVNDVSKINDDIIFSGPAPSGVYDWMCSKITTDGKVILFLSYKD